jgi:CHAD domain-containing protein
MNLPVDDCYRSLAARYIRKQARQLHRELDNLDRADNIECVHQARVATRRLRAGLRMFAGCLPPTKVKRWRRAIRRITIALGEARDRDVQIQFLCGVLGQVTDKNCYPGIARLLVRAEKQRERVQANVVRAGERFQAGGFLEGILAATQRILKKAKRRHLGLQSEASYLQTEWHILQSLNAMTHWQDSLSDVEAAQEHHALRIAAKRLRYTLEIARPVYAGRLAEPLAAAKQLQTMLGDVHDCDVWLEYLAAFVKKERRRIREHFGHDGPFERLRIGIEHLAQQRRGQRETTFRELVDFWRRLEQRGVWDALVTTIGPPRAETEGRAAPGTAGIPREPGELPSGEPSVPPAGKAADDHDGHAGEEDLPFASLPPCAHAITTSDTATGWGPMPH